MPKNKSHENQGAKWDTGSGHVGTLELGPAWTPHGEGAPSVMWWSRRQERA